jgi:hypothetical protein
MAATLRVRLPAGVPDAIRELVVGTNGDGTTPGSVVARWTEFLPTS